ncbi:MAG: 4Fe-4S binding protein [Candidatus Thorarchaeota archaeon]
MYPRVKKVQTDEFNEIEINFYTENYSIKIDREKCIGCGLCIKACPNNAISYPDLEGKIRVKTADLIPDSPDIHRCSYCGTCAYICPLTAISLKYNGEEISINEMGIIKKRVVPKLDYKLVKDKKIQNDIKVYFDGKISVDWDKCISCMSCTEVCPSGAFFKINKNKDTIDSKNRKLSFNQNKCISCGTCVRACSKNAISLKINDINYSGDYKAIFWESLLNRLKI